MTRPFYADEPPAVIAVIELAAARDMLSEDVWARQVATWLPAAAHAAMSDIAGWLDWIGRLDSQDAATTLRAYHQAPSLRFMGAADVEADKLRDQLQADVVHSAQLIASVTRAAA
jgi:hypothetical protein